MLIQEYNRGQQTSEEKQDSHERYTAGPDNDLENSKDGLMPTQDLAMQLAK